MNIIIVNCFDTYEHRVDLLYEAFKNSGHEIKVLTSNFRHFKKSKRIDSKTDYIFFEAKPYKRNFSFQRIYSHYKIAKDIFGYVETICERVDLIWILIPPNSFVKEAAKLKRGHKNIKIVFDVIDLWPETMPAGAIKNYFPFSFWKNIRDKNIGCANFVVTECALFQRKLDTVIAGINTEVLYLARPLVSYEPLLNLPDNRINLCYLGSINNIIDIDVIVKIIQTIIEKNAVELHIVGDGEQKERLIKAAEQAGANVVFHGTVYDRNEKQRIFDNCHFGLNIMKESVCVGLTMKSIDYMEFGLPIINNIVGDTWDIIEKEKIGINIDDLDMVQQIAHDLSYRDNTRKFFETHLTKEIFNTKLHMIIDNI